MGSFPSQEQAVHPAAAVPEPDAAAAQHHLQTHGRTTHALVKKLTQGRLLFLGLDGAGKSTIVAQLTRACDEECTNIHTTSIAGEHADEPRDAREYPNASKAFASWSYKLERDCYLQIADVPGRRAFRRRWYTASLGAPSDTPSSYASSLAGSALSSQPLPLLGVVFVVDASDRVRFPVVAEELVRFQKLKEQKKTLRRAQFFLLLNKTDIAAASSSTVAAQQTDAQQLASNAARRTAMRTARRELKKCVDHRLRLDQIHNPSAYQQSTLVAAPIVRASGPSAVPDTSPPGAPMSGGSLKAPVGAIRSAAAAAEATVARSTVMMTSILECCAHDRASVKDIHAWIKDEIKKTMSAAGQ